MSPRVLVVLAAAWLWVAAASQAATVPAPARAATRKHALAHAPKPVATVTGASATGAPRRLEDIHIEGEIPTPQVLFITARDQRRFLDLQDRRYLRTAQQLADSTRLPAQVLVNRVRPAHDKETSR